MVLLTLSKLVADSDTILNNKTNSIKKNLIIGLTALGGGLLISSLILNIIISKKLENEFNNTMQAKALVIVTLVKQDEAGIEFDFADEFMPEFSRTKNPEYFQIWVKQTTIERSNSLNKNNLEKIKTTDTTISFIDVTLPNKRQGRMIQITFYAQITNKSLRGILEPIEVTMAFAKDRKDLDELLNYLNIGFLIFLVIITLVSTLVIYNIIHLSLEPLSLLTKQIEDIHSDNLNARIKLAPPVYELIPFINQFNNLLEQIEKSIVRERRFSSDIAHELRTPIAEIRNLAEITLRFSDDKLLQEDFNQEIVDTTIQMETLLSLILELSKNENQQIVVAREKIILSDFIKLLWERLKERKNKKEVQLILKCPPDFIINTNSTLLKSMLVNLLNNAITYCNERSNIICESNQDNETMFISISNEVNNNLQQSDLPIMFDRLWRKDISRTSNKNYGLGLALVKLYAEQLQMNIDTQLIDSKFTITLSYVIDEFSNIR